jgi:hypothetical protein
VNAIRLLSLHALSLRATGHAQLGKAADYYTMLVRRGQPYEARKICGRGRKEGTVAALCEAQVVPNWHYALQT